MHGHGHALPRDAAAHALGVGVVLHAVVMVAEAVVGWAAGSLALLSDAGHMASDVASLLLAYVSQRLRTRAPEGYTFGLRRLPVLGGFANALSLLVVVALIVAEAVERMSDPPRVVGAPVLVTAVVGLLVNVLGAWLLARSGDRSLNVRGALLHVIADALGSVAAVVSGVVVMTSGWMLIDPIASVVISLFILFAALPLVRAAIQILLQRAPCDVDMSELGAAIQADADVASLEDLHLWELDTGQRVLSAVLLSQRETLQETQKAADRLRAMLHDRFAVDHATLEMRPAGSERPHHHF